MSSRAMCAGQIFYLNRFYESSSFDHCARSDLAIFFGSQNGLFADIDSIGKLKAHDLLECVARSVLWSGQ